MALDQAKEYLKQRDQMQNKSDMNRAYKLVKQDEVYEQVNKNMMVQFKELCLWQKKRGKTDGALKKSVAKLMVWFGPTFFKGWVQPF